MGGVIMMVGRKRGSGGEVGWGKVGHATQSTPLGTATPPRKCWQWQWNRRFSKTASASRQTLDMFLVLAIPTAKLQP